MKNKDGRHPLLQGLFDTVEDKKPKKMPDAEWKKKHRKAIGTICKWLDISTFHHVEEETNIKIYEKSNSSI